MEGGGVLMACQRNLGEGVVDKSRATNAEPQPIVTKQFSSASGMSSTRAVRKMKVTQRVVPLICQSATGKMIRRRVN
jgi:hypothetical protein